MAVTARKVNMYTVVTPYQEESMSETRIGTYTDAIANTPPMMAKCNKTLTTVQDEVEWASFLNNLSTYDMITDDWETVAKYWDEGGMVLSTSGAMVSGNTSIIQFIYIKNTGDTNNVLMSLEGDSASDYVFKVSPGGILCIGTNSGGHDTFIGRDIWLKTDSGATTVEYIVAD